MIKKYYTLDEAVRDSECQGSDVKFFMPKNLGQASFYLALSLLGVRYKRFYIDKKEEEVKRYVK